MADLLSASSLLLAIVAILFSLWFPEIVKTLERVPKPHKEDNVAARNSVTGVLFTKALPVAVMASAVAAIFMPDALKLVNEAFYIYQDHCITADGNYNAVKTAYCFVTTISVVLAIYMWKLVISLYALRKNLSQ